MNNRDALSFYNNTLRVGGTSWVIPGTFSENLRCLSKDVSDMEIVLFDTPEQSNIPSKDEVKELGYLLGELGMTCNIHFPIDVCDIEVSNIKERIRCEDICLRITELFSPIEPFAWILHLVGENRGKCPSNDLDIWRELTHTSALRIASSVDDKSRICAETLDNEFSYIIDIVKETGISVCLDIGHLVKYDYPVLKLAKEYMTNTRMIHLHGVMPDGTDHVDISYFDQNLLSEVIKLTNDGKKRVMTLEVFEEDYARSIAVMKEFRNLFEE